MWDQYLDNNKFITMLYDKVPELIDVEISGIQVIHDGPAIKIGVDLAKYADHPPKKWDKSFNTVSMTLEFFELEELSWQGWSTTNIGNIDISKGSDGKLTVLVKTDQMNLAFKAGFVFTQDIRGVCREDRIS